MCMWQRLMMKQFALMELLPPPLLYFLRRTRHGPSVRVNSHRGCVDASEPELVGACVMR
jgi:hypothetical protein